MAMWNPWRGCKRCSDGCLHCYIHKGDAKRGVDTSQIVKTKDFAKPAERLKNGRYKMKAGIVYTCFSTDFLIQDADSWRGDCWQMIKERPDCTFLFLTKRIDRFMECVPEDWNDGYENVAVGCTIENQKNADYKLAIFSKLPIKHKCITAQPLLEQINIEKYLDDVELVVVGGESDVNARPLDYAWVLDIREQCIRKNVSFEFRQCGTNFIKDGKKYRLMTRDLCSQAKKAGIDFKAKRRTQ
ncbi:MAG: phage Gp37/Gp68 family protein [[Eubacterium] saphenum]|nr:phage Gp37/Gp68 family protein [[Eubacterium] saphenum]